MGSGLLRSLGGGEAKSEDTSTFKSSAYITAASILLVKASHMVTPTSVGQVRFCHLDREGSKYLMNNNFNDHTIILLYLFIFYYW